ncbi:conjugal transfer protein, partial [Mediterraneibacter faecis]|uniref:conjugal transfer protein n=1 Tax=Mediterraneibacter faecis TaxID=592978 RepID=UPI00210DDD94
QILDTHNIENFVKNFAEVYYSLEQSSASIDSLTNALKGYLTGELQPLNVDTVRKDIPVSSAMTDFQIWEIT